MAKPTRLRYTGHVRKITDDDGNVVAVEADRFFAGVPARNLDEADIAQLDAATLKTIMGGSNPLYVDDSPEAEPAKAEAKSEAKVAEKPAERVAGKDNR